MSKSYSQSVHSGTKTLEKAKTLRKWILALLPHTSNEVLQGVEFTNTGVRLAIFEQSDGERCNVCWNDDGYEVFTSEAGSTQFDEMNPAVDYIDENLLEE
jgi:hypothetical protein